MGLFGFLEPKKRRRKPRRYTAEHVRLTKGGYDRRGRYWGVGERLYRVTDTETNYEKYVRAGSAKSAIASACASNAGWR